jgi:hypothetical protein
MVKLCVQCVYYSKKNCIHPSNMKLDLVSGKETPEFLPSLYRLDILGISTCGQDGRLFVQRG